MLTARRFFEPLILGGAMRLHPLLTILSMIVGIMLYGLGGILLGPMILVVIRRSCGSSSCRTASAPICGASSTTRTATPEKLRIRDLKAADPDAKTGREATGPIKASENTKTNRPDFLPTRSGTWRRSPRALRASWRTRSSRRPARRSKDTRSRLSRRTGRRATAHLRSRRSPDC